MTSNSILLDTTSLGRRAPDGPIVSRMIEINSRGDCRWAFGEVVLSRSSLIAIPTFDTSAGRQIVDEKTT